MNAGLNLQTVNDEESREAAPQPRPDRIVTEQELDALRYTGALRGAPGSPDPGGGKTEFGAGRSMAVPGQVVVGGNGGGDCGCPVCWSRGIGGCGRRPIQGADPVASLTVRTSSPA